jgi:hypothetical protein
MFCIFFIVPFLKFTYCLSFSFILFYNKYNFIYLNQGWPCFIYRGIPYAPDNVGKCTGGIL